MSDEGKARVYAVHYVDYDGGRVGKTWSLRLFKLHADAMKKVETYLSNPNDDWTFLPADSNRSCIPEKNRVSPVWWNASYHSVILYVTEEEVN